MATTTPASATELGLDLTDRELYRHGFPHEQLALLRDEPVSCARPASTSSPATTSCAR